MAKSPLAPAQFPTLPNVAGVRFGTLAAGIKYQNRSDVMLAEHSQKVEQMVGY